ncbi:MAG: exodeoxyribonuclease III [Arenicellales bacterium WSBS_2016_MAG_OTU3]
MRIITCNLNGIRAAGRKGFFEWMLQQNADAVCVQETKAQQDQITDELYHPEGWHAHFVDAEKKGYSGVGIYTPHKPDKVHYGIGWKDFDSEGRYLQMDFGKLSVVSIYMPSGTSGDIRQDVKYDFMERLKDHFLAGKRKRSRQYIFCGDWNIAHKEIDLKNWRGNRKNSGFLPDERAWLDWLYDEAGYVDVFRTVEPGEDQYTWWSNRGQAWDKNVGWRLDYHVATAKIAATAKAVAIYKDQRFSDHAPLTIDYDSKLFL